MIKLLSDTPIVFTIDQKIPADTCKQILSLVDPEDFSLAPITIGKDEFLVDTNYRNNTRVIMDNIELSNNLFSLIKDFLPVSHKGWILDGLNSRFRYYRYTPEQKFEKHFDGRYRETLDRESRLTLLLYLEDECTGGETAFFNTSDESLRFLVNPKRGQILVFDHHQLHSGEPIITGTKTVLRTDVMYKRQMPN